MKTRWAFCFAILAGLTAFVVDRSPWAMVNGSSDADGAYAGVPDRETFSATPGDCSSTHPSAMAPTLPPKLMRSTVVRCRVSFEILHSGLTRTPLWVSERLTREGVSAARGMERVDSFEADAGIDPSSRAELSDYRRSGWDRGHMAPNGDMPDAASQEQSFELSNISPQAPRLNRGAWAELESDVRSYVSRNGLAYVVTGVLFEGARLDTLPGGRVTIPTSLWKAVLAPRSGSVVMVATNENGATPVAMSLDAFKARTGIDPFPAASLTDRSTVLDISDGERR